MKTFRPLLRFFRPLFRSSSRAASCCSRTADANPQLSKPFSFSCGLRLNAELRLCSLDVGDGMVSSCESLLPVDVGRRGFLNHLPSQSACASFQKFGMAKGNNAGSSNARLYVSKENGNVGFGLINFVQSFSCFELWSEISLSHSTDRKAFDASLFWTNLLLWPTFLSPKMIENDSLVGDKDSCGVPLYEDG